MVKWKKEDVERVTGAKIPKQAPAVKIPRSLPVGIQHIKNQMTILGIDFVIEYRFHDDRKFRFDFAIPELKIAIEYEGLLSEKSGHTTLGGYTSDCEKYNLAVTEGWRLLRYTAINYRDFITDIQKLIP
jgi:hypothetical protein